jgi:hypothetical protein
VWSPQVKNAMTPDDSYATGLAFIVSRFTNFHASIRSKLQTDSTIILCEALLLDAELEEWKMQLPQSWQYRLEQHSEETAVMYKGVSHRYRDFWTARIYNHYRWCRILVNELLLTQLGSVSSEDAAQRRKSLDLISSQAAEICNSVSIQFHKPTLLQEARQNGVPAMSGCFLPLFGLAVAGSAVGGKLLSKYFVNVFYGIWERGAVSAAGICFHGLGAWLCSNLAFLELHQNTILIRWQFLTNFTTG